MALVDDLLTAPAVLSPAYYVMAAALISLVVAVNWPDRSRGKA
jgi:hypothetical protein